MQKKYPKTYGLFTDYSWVLTKSYLFIVIQHFYYTEKR